MRQELKNLKLAVSREKELSARSGKKKGGKKVSDVYAREAEGRTELRAGARPQRPGLVQVGLGQTLAAPGCFPGNLPTCSAFPGSTVHWSTKCIALRVVGS